MDEARFDALIRALTVGRSRRDVLRGLVAVGLGLGALRRQEAAEAKKKRKKKKPKRNAFGCVDVGTACGGKRGKCCSGICEGKKPKKGKKGKKDEKDKSSCVAHNTGICFADTDSCAAGVNVPCNPSNPSCFCTLTTGNAGFCGAFTGGPAGHCRVCSKDTDCEAEFGPGAACLVLGGICTPLCVATGRTACAPPCA